jgi:multicomponent Na+:H+ antiporter subunit C
MSLSIWYAVIGIALFTLGIWGLFACEHLLRKILALNIASTGVFLFLVAAAYRRPGAAPDPVPHAMVLTGIVVAVSTTALALAIAQRIHACTRKERFNDAEE